MNTTSEHNTIKLIGFLISALALFLINIAFSARFTFASLTLIRVISSIVLLVTYFYFHKTKQIPYDKLFLGLFAVSVGYLIGQFFSAGRIGLDVQTADGVALSKYLTLLKNVDNTDAPTEYIQTIDITYSSLPHLVPLS